MLPTISYGSRRSRRAVPRQGAVGRAALGRSPSAARTRKWMRVRWSVNHETGLHDRVPWVGQLVAQIAGDVVQDLPRSLLGRPLTRRRQQVGDGANRGRDEAVERPYASLLPLEQAGLGQDPKVVAHRGL
jgi:hypothetical protein